MIRFIIKLLFTYLVLFPFFGSAQGIRFNSSESPIVERTSYNVFAHDQQKFIGDFSIEFDLSIIDSKIFGYILNIKDQNKPISYSLAYINSTEEYGELKFNLDGVKELMSVPINKQLIGSRKWMKVVLNFKSEEITLSLNDLTFSSFENKFSNIIIPQIYFGKHGSVIDVPLMAIKNLTIKNKNKKTVFNFKESNGNNVYGTDGNIFGEVDHPNWLITESYHWKLISSRTFEKVTSVTYDENNNRFIYQNLDSLSFYDHTNNKSDFYSFKNNLKVPMRLGTSFLDPNENKLYVYELSDVLEGNPTISSIDLNNPDYWLQNSYQKLSQQRHHHNGFFDYKTKKYLIFGGYGNQLYTNDFNTYDVVNDNWSIEEFNGDIISPRFFSGTTKLGDQNLLIFGGQGNSTGEQSIGKTYYYDCYKVNLKTKKIEKLWEINRENKKLVSSRNIVLSNDSKSFYSLSYPEYISSTFLQLH